MSAAGPARFAALGVLVGALGICVALVWAPFRQAYEERAETQNDVDRVEVRPRATQGERDTWHAEWARRAKPWTTIPDPPGEGPVHRARYWVSHGVYDMEVRRRGTRLVLGIHGVDQQVMGGGWIAFGEGTITVPTSTTHPFAGCEARITWSCLGVRFRYASDGVAYLTFGADGTTLFTTYNAYEDPDYWAAAHGVQQGAKRPAWGTVAGQIVLARHKRGRLRLHGPATLHVRVVDTSGAPVSRATVQPKGNDRIRMTTDDGGRAVLSVAPGDFDVGPVVSAGAYGFQSADAVLPRAALGRKTAQTVQLTVTLARMHTRDDPRYVWHRPDRGHDADDAMACGTCHEWHYQEWILSRHALSADNGHVAYVTEQLRKTPGASVTLDCDGCHRPGHAAYESAPFSRRSALSGNHCDLCHKISHVGDIHASGVLGSLYLVRPSPDSAQRPGGIHQVFGPRADSTFAYMGAVYNPLFEASHLCAGCHQGGGAHHQTGLPKMNTFEEWRAWAATRRDESFRSCQDCHMPGATTRNQDGMLLEQLAWDGIHRTPGTVHSHRFAGTEPRFARTALRVDIDKRRVDGALEVVLAVTNVGAGHHVPTGSWTKHVLVGVWARQGEQWLPLREGPRALVVATHESEHGLAAGDWRNPAGFILGVQPRQTVGSRFRTPMPGHAWTAATIHDTRLAPGSTVRETFRFDLTAADGAPQVEVRVAHRRGAFGADLRDVPWEIRPRDPLPHVLWHRIVR